MKRSSKNLVGLGLILFFTFGVLCTTLAIPSQSLASETGCSQHNRAMEMTDCEHPSYLCALAGSSYLLSEGALSSARSNDSVKNLLGIASGEACSDSSAYSGPFVWNEHASAFPAGRHKVSIHLFNSVLNI